MCKRHSTSELPDNPRALSFVLNQPAGHALVDRHGRGLLRLLILVLLSMLRYHGLYARITGLAMGHAMYRYRGMQLCPSPEFV